MLQWNYIHGSLGGRGKYLQDRQDFFLQIHKFDHISAALNTFYLISAFHVFYHFSTYVNTFTTSVKWLFSIFCLFALLYGAYYWFPVSGWIARWCGCCYFDVAAILGEINWWRQLPSGQKWENWKLRGIGREIKSLWAPISWGHDFATTAADTHRPPKNIWTKVTSSIGLKTSTVTSTYHFCCNPSITYIPLYLNVFRPFWTNCMTLVGGRC